MRTLLHRTALSAVACLSLACSSADGESADTGEPVSDDGPGGSMEPTDPVDDPNGDTNDCGIHSGYPGDDLCIPPPDPSEGIQLWVGPTDYDNPDAVAPYLLEAGGENVVCFNSEPVDGGFHYLEQKNRMRSGSHHMLIGLQDAAGREAGPTSECDLASRIGSVPGSQTPRRDFLADGFGPEDEGLARWFPESAIANFQLHYVNTSDEPVMREAWINLYFKDEAEVTNPLNSVFLVGDLSVAVPPQQRQLTPLSFSPSLEESTRIFELTGHSHAHNERFSAWINRGTADEVLVYESYDWAEPDVLRYNTVTDNPPPDPVAKTDGGVSGLLFIEPGDTLDFECEVNNTTDATLRFANEAYTAEMCLLSGGYVGATGGLFAGGCSAGSCFGFGGSR